jgi:hypothetical protein
MRCSPRVAELVKLNEINKTGRLKLGKAVTQRNDVNKLTALVSTRSGKQLEPCCLGASGQQRGMFEPFDHSSLGSPEFCLPRDAISSLSLLPMIQLIVNVQRKSSNS